MSLAPIVIFAYNRLDHLKECLQSLEKARGARESELFLFADGYKSDKDKEKVLAVHEFLKDYEKTHGFSRLEVVYGDRNKGLAASVISGVSNLMERYGKVIVVEDDLVVSEDFLEYMNGALEHYQDNKKVWQISGWSPKEPSIQTIPEDTFLWYRSSSWGWATWKDRWDMVDWDVKDYSKFRWSVSMRHRMKRGGADMADMLDMQMQGRINSWAIRFAYTESMNNMYTVFPTNSKVENCGRDGSGTNCHATSESHPLREMIDNNKEKYVWGSALPARSISRKIYRSYSGSRMHCVKWRIKSLFDRLGIRKM